uniref:Uncharacterized protein n=1 Tax=virus sp. ct5rm7 TaxID=2827298 RepID=A0A8S5RFW2_9VIRU|nr:MAG TPA: hypothetical protein [virus sp. ct5rm7]
MIPCRNSKPSFLSAATLLKRVPGRTLTVRPVFY